MSIKESNKKIIVIGGPTGAGKTQLGIKIARELDGELINADSRQIYKYLDIGTNKGELVLSNNQYEIDNIPIHLVNLIEPNERFDLFRFQKLALEKIEDILKRKKLPILVGGTGLYIDSILKDYELGIIDDEVNLEERQQLESLTIDILQQKVKEISKNKISLNSSDWNNPRRLIRYIERLGTGAPKQMKAETITPVPSLESLFLYPEYNWEELKLKINNRVIEMFNEGLVNETKNVLSMGYKETDPGLQVMGYKEIIKYLNNKITVEECINLVQTAHRQYARRQRTWFEGEGRDYNLIKVQNSYEAVKEISALTNFPHL